MEAELAPTRARAGPRSRAGRADAARRPRLNALLSRPPADDHLAVEGEAFAHAPLPAVEWVVAPRGVVGNARLCARIDREVAIEERRLGLLKAERVPTPMFSVGVA